MTSVPLATPPRSLMDYRVSGYTMDDLELVACLHAANPLTVSDSNQSPHPMPHGLHLPFQVESMPCAARIPAETVKIIFPVCFATSAVYVHAATWVITRSG